VNGANALRPWTGGASFFWYSALAYGQEADSPIMFPYLDWSPSLESKSQDLEKQECLVLNGHSSLEGLWSEWFLG